ncbi:exodeoxyribonuclease V subunit gamma [Massilia psychrophila]|uniref:RecBCD enzyme subunit RecC n=1 Tax=Massilia psychrophila TaxID=1603353 RepID=A0A2G8T2S4_9BURK|nr:exodeoxyribonuclease V subunit gamma [Massilia psychrophila]PIL40346.1 exodeoxyribonuclease V subunit gamma [Massilia psychrophila]GGE77907.1 RecBCD enzyme subunit RecC [Massilia psychrophila]
MASPVAPGLLILHGNQLEQLRAALFGWLRDHPLAPLESEIVLVQSNGVAEWLKISLAENIGVCAATRVALPARFLWETYRAMLGRGQVPQRSPYDKAPLTWRLMRLLPVLLAEEVFSPLRHFLGDGDPERRLQLTERISDLFDQYQVYRADWLDDWAGGRDVLRGARGEQTPLPADQLWQAALWRAVNDSLPEAEQLSGRATIHNAFVRAIEAGEAPAARLPRRVVLFGISALPYQTLQAVAALSRHCQVLLAVPNPCQFYWGDIIEGHELLKARRRRQPPRGGVDRVNVPIEDMHTHSHPLLAGWGRQGRDFVRMLDEFDSEAQGRVDNLRVDLFSEGEGDTLLGQVQAAVRDLLPLCEHPRNAAGAAPSPGDRSIEFHVAHSAQREVEVLHDQLLSWFACASASPLRPRDIVVMVPDIDTFTAAIHAVFDQHKRSDPRFIPFEIGDIKDRSVKPLLVALEWLLCLPQQRCRQSEVRDLLDVPALAARFGLLDADLPILGQWIEGAAVRWGLDQQHRNGLGLGSAGEQNAWIFGVRRMLLGYASGAGASFQGIEPYAEVGGLDAALAGSLAQLIETLLAWRASLDVDRTPAEWNVQARALLAAFFDVSSEADRLSIGQLHDALQAWLETCSSAEFAEPVPLAVLREAWLGALDEPTLAHQFVSGGVTFCSLMPMRAVPFRVVCLLGMNDGDFPRRSQQADFDLLTLPGMARPGDRSRRDDDRYLMLEAVLSAREKLYVSWVGRNVRDNSEQPASVLVSQLRDYLAAGWDLDLAGMTTEHALQPFSRRYFEQGGLPTYAGEWRAAHTGAPFEDDSVLPPFELEPDYRLKLGELANFLRQPARYFFRRRLGVWFADVAALGQDEEPFSFNALERYLLEDSLLEDSQFDDGQFDVNGAGAQGEVRASLTARAARLAREGVLPIGLIGRKWQEQLVDALLPVRTAWLTLGARFPGQAPKLPIGLRFDGIELDDWIDRLRTMDAAGAQGADNPETAWLTQISSKVLDKKGGPRGDKLIGPWVRQLAAAACGHKVTGYLVARDAIVTMAPLEAQQARTELAALITLWRKNLDQPLPVACKTALAQLRGDDARATYDGGFELSGEVDDLCLARLWPDFAALAASGEWAATAVALYGPLANWLGEHIAVTKMGEQSAEPADLS